LDRDLSLRHGRFDEANEADWLPAGAELLELSGIGRYPLAQPNWESRKYSALVMAMNMARNGAARWTKTTAL
jgi:hypothetical protein